MMVNDVELEPLKLGWTVRSQHSLTHLLIEEFLPNNVVRCSYMDGTKLTLSNHPRKALIIISRTRQRPRGFSIHRGDLPCGPYDFQPC